MYAFFFSKEYFSATLLSNGADQFEILLFYVELSKIIETKSRNEVHNKIFYTKARIYTKNNNKINAASQKVRSYSIIYIFFF